MNNNAVYIHMVFTIALITDINNHTLSLLQISEFNVNKHQRRQSYCNNQSSWVVLG